MSTPVLTRHWLLVGILACLLPILAPWVSLRVNTTHSHPAWVFLILKTRPPHVGDLAVLSWPTDAYWPQHALMLKPVIAEGPVHLAVHERTLTIDGQPWGTAVATGSHRQPLPVPTWDGLVPSGWVLLGTTTVWDSWDSRYYGPVPQEWLSGTAIPLW